MPNVKNCLREVTRKPRLKGQKVDHMLLRYDESVSEHGRAQRKECEGHLRVPENASRSVTHNYPAELALVGGRTRHGLNIVARRLTRNLLCLNLQYSGIKGGGYAAAGLPPLPAARRPASDVAGPYSRLDSVDQPWIARPSASESGTTVDGTGYDNAAVRKVMNAED